MKLLHLLCLTGAVPVAVSVLTLTSVLVMKPMTWADAQNYCRKVYLNLTTAKSQASLLKLRDTLVKLNVSGPVWMGLYNNYDTWRWSFNSRLLSNTTVNVWKSLEPDNYDGHEWCGGIDIDGQWWDEDCLLKYPFICYDAIGARKYVGVTIPLNWADAQSYCRQHYTDLASPFTPADNDLVQQVAVVQGFSWFGLFRDEWRWVDGTKVGRFMWQLPLPNNADPQEDCGTITDGRLDDKKCTEQYYFFCDAVPVRKHMVKVQVKADGSVLESAMQSAILEQIKQKLDKNATVSWRVRPDGKVFYKKIQSHSP